MATKRCNNPRNHAQFTTVQVGKAIISKLCAVCLKLPCRQDIPLSADPSTTPLDVDCSVTTFCVSSDATVDLETNPSTTQAYDWEDGKVKYFANLFTSTANVTLQGDGLSPDLVLMPGEAVCLYRHGSDSFWIALSGAGTSLGESGFSVVWRPGYAGPPQANLFSDWADVIDALGTAASRPPVDLYFDPSDSPTGVLTLPSGTFDMTNVRWVMRSGFATPALALVSVIIPQGTFVTNLRNVEGPMEVEYEGTTAPMEVVDAASLNRLVYLTHLGTLRVSGTQPMFRVDDPTASGLAFTLTMDAPASIFNSVGAPASIIEVVNGAAAFVIATGGSFSMVGDDTLASDGSAGSFIKILYDDGSQISRPFSVATNQSGVVGATSFFLLRAGSASQRITAAVPPGATDDNTAGFAEGDLWVDTVANMMYGCVDDSTGAAIWNLL